jgi:polyferredoxin
LRFGWRDWGLLAVLGAAGLMTFGRAAWRHRAWWPYRIFLVGYVGLATGDLMAQALLAGWARSGIPWTTAPGLVLLVVTAFVLPWGTRQPFYCHHVCPHGAAQELIGRLRPAWLTIRLPRGAVRGLEWLPAALLLLVLVVAMLALPFELTGLEPFHAYLVRAAGWATVGVALAGLVAAGVVPQAYCRFGCPTGALLNFVRARGPTDRFSRRDGVALVFVAVAAVLNWWHLPIITWVKGMP